jgi:2-oxoisovalerate dehydrogenase E2 component (dihydrolipoyl transacylase)
VLVGYGVKAEQTPLRRPRRTPHGADHVEPGPPGERGRPVRQGGLELGRALETRLGGDQVRAKPPVRRLARDLDVDLSLVVPSGPDGTITHDDVSRAAAAARGPVAPARAVPMAPVARAADSGGSAVVPLTHVGRMMAQAMTSSAFTAVHVTEWVDVDVTAMTSLIRSARSREDMAGLSITPLTFAALGLVRAAHDHPTVNASLDEAGENLLMHPSVHLGIAVDSPRGLIVPRIADAQELDLRGMGDALARLIETARAGRSRPEDLRGSTITITNVGVFGVDGGTPILNPGEVAILALGRVLPRPWVLDGRVEVRDVVTLALSFDHRVVDGALGSRVLREVADFMADPATVLTLS